MHPPFRKIVDHRSAASLAAHLRRRRFELFNSIVSRISKPVHILDVGGEQVFWKVMGLVGSEDYRITLLNIYPVEVSLPYFSSVLGDATDLSQFSDQEFDLVFSNSVIEHLGSLREQQRMAREVQRVGRNYYVQTPNRYFPLEPHFLIPFFQFFPENLQVALLQRFDLGWYQKMPDREAARQHVRSHRLLTERELRRLFAGGSLYKEKIFGLTKSFVAYGSSNGWLSRSNRAV
jgi:hypothetical protein